MSNQILTFQSLDRSDKALSDRSDSPIPVFLENGGRPPTTTVGSLPIDSLQQQWGMMYPVMAVNADPSMMGMVPMNFNQVSIPLCLVISVVHSKNKSEVRLMDSRLFLT